MSLDLNSVNKLEVVNTSELPEDIVVSFDYKKPAGARENRVLILQDSDANDISGTDLNRSGEYRRFKRDRIKGNITIWGKVSFSNLLK